MAKQSFLGLVDWTSDTGTRSSLLNPGQALLDLTKPGCALGGDKRVRAFLGAVKVVSLLGSGHLTIRDGAIIEKLPPAFLSNPCLSL